MFFEDPLAVAAEGAPIERRESPDGRRSDHSAPTDAGAEPIVETHPKGGPTETPGIWERLISGEDLAGETLAIRASLADKLQSIGKYNGNYKQARYDAATLAALAVIAGEHSEAPGWRTESRYIRDVSAQIARLAVGPGDRNFKPTRAAYDQLELLLSGRPPPGLQETAEKIPVSELVTRTPLMYRMERTFNWMKTTVNTEQQFKRESSKLAHEGAVLATLARVIAEAGYPDADVDEYQSYSLVLSDSGLGVIEAVKDGNFAAYRAALDGGGKACAECHLSFKNN